VCLILKNVRRQVQVWISPVLQDLVHLEHLSRAFERSRRHKDVRRQIVVIGGIVVFIGKTDPSVSPQGRATGNVAIKDIWLFEQRIDHKQAARRVTGDGCVIRIDTIPICPLASKA